MNLKIKPEHKKYIRLVAGIIIVIFGAVFMMVPFIPLGYVFLIAGLMLLTSYIPPLKRLIEKFREKDDKNRVEKVEKKINDGEKIISERIVGEEGKKEK
jgi:uncharacterized membrane protein HdeD (DUF308 family)